jgi:rhamnose utilization protein RhaD (predicted bifunctional aldolase and dehydrogenase)
VEGQGREPHAGKPAPPCSPAGELLSDLVDLARALAGPSRAYAILGEGNISARVDERCFLVKASGTSLATAAPASFVPVDMARMLRLVADPPDGDAAQGAALQASVLGDATGRPSVEAGLHAVLLGMAGARWVAHTHPAAVNGVLCSTQAAAVAGGALFPDQIVVCGAHPLLMPYIDPGLPLARALATALDGHMDRYGAPPRAVYLQNHGFVAVGHSAADVLAITDMAVKAAAILAATFACGGPRYLPDEEVRRIAGREDEHYRQRMLGLGQGDGG